MIVSVSDRVENIVGKGETAWLLAFSSVPTLISSDFSFMVIKTRRGLINGSNSLPNYKILNYSILKGFADYKINVTEKLKFVLRRVENIVGKGENASYQHFLLFPCFPKTFFSTSLKVGILW